MLQKVLLLAAIGAFGFSLAAARMPAETVAPVQAVGSSDWQGWTGLEATANGGGLAIPGEAVFRYPDGPLGAYHHGFRAMDDGAADWSGCYGVRFTIDLPDERGLELTTTIRTPGTGDAGIAAVVRVRGRGPHEVTLPWTAFGFEQARTSFLRAVKSLAVAARYPDGSAAGRAVLREVAAITAPAVALEAEVRGRSAAAGESADYTVRVSNATSHAQAVMLGFVRHGWEEMAGSVDPSTLDLAPGETRTCTVRVSVPERVPSGGHEDQVLQAVANGNAATAARLTLTTVRALPHPYLLHTPARWQEVRDKVKNYPWAKEAQVGLVQTADAWQVPEIASPPRNDPNDNYGPYLFATQNENGLLACGCSWQLTGNRAHAEKVAEFLRRLSDPDKGYPATFRACNQSLVQEGHFFQHIAMSYDMILDSGVLAVADRARIDTTLRLFMDTIERAAEGGAINNWNLSEVTGAFYCALAVQDLTAAARFFSGPSGIEDQLAKGTLDDGWWYECSISYNLWCASEFTQAALAYQSFGVNFKDAWLPANFTRSVMLASELSGGNRPKVADLSQRRKPFGMDPDIDGPVQRPYRAITDLWNGLLPFLDYRGVMFGVNDSAESKVSGHRTEVGGQPFEIAYYAYRDPRYAAVIKRAGGTRDLLYGVPELPEQTPEEFRASAFADNVGLAMLRSQTPGRPVREQIQAALHYGTHGWAHGHFDRTDLLSLMRYGRSFWNPESVFWVYEPFMYKFYCQTSDNHNMVVVDQKMQEATPGQRILWHTGKLMQAAAVETTARWSYPPYGGMVYDYVPVKTFAEKTWREGRSVPIPADAPEYGTLTGFTEPILQRRLMVVTDDYVVLADYVKGTQPHAFDDLLQLKGFEGLEGTEKKFLRHDAQWNPDPLGSAQFVTDADWYGVKAPVLGRFTERWGPGADEAGSRSAGNEPGALKLGVHSLWPLEQEIMVATAPEQHDVEKRLFYTVRGDGRTLAEGRAGAWILGQADLDVPVEGLRQIELETRVEISRKPTVFWGDARIVTSDGTEIPLADLDPETTNVLPVSVPDADYFGGPVKIAGNACRHATPGQPQDEKEPAVVRVDLTGRNAVRFKATLGSDYPPGPEEQRRKVYAVRAPRGTEARFLTVVEPYENQSAIRSAVALDANKLRVDLQDGRTQEITIENLDGPGQDVSVRIVESKDGVALRQESNSRP